MKTRTLHTITALTVAAAGSLACQSHAQSILNGGFESGLSGWTTADLLGSDGTFFIQTGATSPVNGFAVAAPSEGSRSAMTDSGAGGSHALYQDFVVPSIVNTTSIRFSLQLNNGAGAYFTPNSLDWSLTNQAGAQTLNQQARVDILTTASDVFSVATVDVLQNLFATTTSTPAVTGYVNFDIDITAILQAHAGETLRLRFAETDNVNFFNFGVDNVRFNVIPMPTTILIAAPGLAALAQRRRR